MMRAGRIAERVRTVARHGRTARTLSAAVALAFALAGCAVGPKYERPAIDLPSEYPEIAAAGGHAGASLRADWWKLYGDPLLDALIAAALERNADLKLAAAQIEEAAAVLREAGASFLPQIDVTGNSNRTGFSTTTAQSSGAGVPSVRTGHRFAFSTTFELDFWGKLRSASDAAQARLLATQYGQDVVRLTLASATAQTYFALRSFDAQIAVTRATLASREDSVKIVTDRVKAGYSSDLDLYQANLLRASAAAQLRELQRQRAAFEHQLQALTATPELRVAALDTLELPLPALPPPGLPSTLLERRPDIVVAEQNLISANAQIGVARAAQFPTFSLTGFLGGESESLLDILHTPSRIWSIGAGVLFPIFDSGKYAARTEQAAARQRQAAALYQKSVETAFREVADALSNIRLAVLAEADLRAAVEAAEGVQRIAEVRYAAGYSAYLEVLDAQRNANETRLALARNRQQQLAFTVDFIKAVGGGWSPGAVAVEAQRRS